MSVDFTKMLQVFGSPDAMREFLDTDAIFPGDVIIMEERPFLVVSVTQNGLPGAYLVAEVPNPEVVKGQEPYLCGNTRVYVDPKAVERATKMFRNMVALFESPETEARFEAVCQKYGLDMNSIIADLGY